MNNSNSANKWIADNPEDVKLFREAWENKSMTNGDIASMFSLTSYAKDGENSSSSPFVSSIAKALGLPAKHSVGPRKPKKEDPFSKVERLKKELAEAQKDQMREAASDEGKIRKFVESMGGIANFQLKLRMIRWN